MSTSGRARRSLTSALLAIALCASRPAIASAGVSPAPVASPAYISLEMPATPSRAAEAWAIVSMSYDADAGEPLDSSPASTNAVNVRGTIVITKSDRATPLLAKWPYAALEIVESDAARKPLRRLTFRHVRIVSIEPDGDEPAERVTFTAGSVIERPGA